MRDKNREHQFSYHDNCLDDDLDLRKKYMPMMSTRLMSEYDFYVNLRFFSTIQSLVIFLNNYQ